MERGGADEDAVVDSPRAVVGEAMTTPEHKKAVTESDPAKMLTSEGTRKPGAADIELEALLSGPPAGFEPGGILKVPSVTVEELLRGPDLSPLPIQYATPADIEALQTDITILDDTIGQLIDEVNERIDGLVTPSRVEALRLAVQLHSRIAGGQINGTVRTSVTATADTLLDWLVKA